MFVIEKTLEIKAPAAEVDQVSPVKRKLWRCPAEAPRPLLSVPVPPFLLMADT